MRLHEGDIITFGGPKIVQSTMDMLAPQCSNPHTYTACGLQSLLPASSPPAQDATQQLMPPAEDSAACLLSARGQWAAHPCAERQETSARSVSNAAADVTCSRGFTGDTPARRTVQPGALLQSMEPLAWCRTQLQMQACSLKRLLLKPHPLLI